MSIHNSNADIAKDLRVLVEKIRIRRIKKGDFEHVHDRYGDFVLFSSFKVSKYRPISYTLFIFFINDFFFFRKLMNLFF